VWDVASGARLARVDSAIIEFSPDQRLLLTRAGDAVRVLPWRGDDLLALACRQLSRNLTGQEWRRHVSQEEPPAKTCEALR